MSTENLNWPLMKNNITRADLDAVIDYLQRLIQFTRTSDVFEYGLSPRAALATAAPVSAACRVS